MVVVDLEKRMTGKVGLQERGLGPAIACGGQVMVRRTRARARACASVGFP